MNLQLSDECPIFRPASEPHLHRFLYTIVQDWHAIIFPAPDRLRQIISNEIWRVYGDYLTQAYKKAINDSKPFRHPIDCARCIPEKVVDYCALPVLLIVENAESDGAWINMVTRVLRRRLSYYLNGNHPRVALYNGGGVGEIPKAILRTSVPYVQNRPDPGFPLRIVILCDSDAKLPNEISDQAVAAKSTAVSVGADIHILRKRAIENYIPDGTLHEWARTRAHARQAVEHITRLTSDQRDYYDMKVGLKEHDITTSDWFYSPYLETGIGLGDFIVDLLDLCGVNISASELHARDGRQELDEFLDVLEKNL
jgi:hypothetical protein